MAETAVNILMLAAIAFGFLLMFFLVVLLKQLHRLPKAHSTAHIISANRPKNIRMGFGQTMKLFQQDNKLGTWWGGIKLVTQQGGVYVQVMTMALAGIGAYTGLLNRGINVPAWLFVLVLAGITGAVMLFEWRTGMPSTFAAWNCQWWQHDNPLRAKIERMEKRQEAIMRKLGIDD